MIASLDHLVLTVRDMEATVAWYERVLGMRRVTFGAGRVALAFGPSQTGAVQKINLHAADAPFAPHAAAPTPGSADLCFLASVPLAQVQACLAAHGIEIEEGPVARTGAAGPLLSVYVRDPDGNLIEISEPLKPTA